jgi:hypothetical protein
LATTEQAAREEAASDFLGALFEKKPEQSFIQIWNKRNKSSSYAKDVRTAAVRAVAVRRDAYVSVGLVSRDLGKEKRGAAKDVIGIPGFWADIDVNGGPDNKTGHAPDVDAALDLVGVALPPTIIVNSGYGIQGWWLFEEPWIFPNGEERKRAAQLSAGWIARMRKEAKARGFTIDAVQDLARLMRVPGTVNGKGGQASDVTVVKDDGPRYSLEVIAEHVEQTSAPVELGERVDIAPDGQLPYKKLEAMIENNDRFAETWKRKRTDFKDQSPSTYCFSIANFCIYAGWDDVEIANVLQYWRSKHDAEEKPDSWYGLTIRKARSTINESKREEEREEAVEKLVEIGQSDEDEDTDEIAQLFSKIIGGGHKVKELVQSNHDPDTAIYRLVMDDGSEVPIGPFQNLDDPNKFAQRFAVAKKYRPPLVKRGDWIKALNGLLKMAVVRDAELTTTQAEVRMALRRYLDATLTPDHNEAAARRDPFERGGYVWIAPKSFHEFMSRHLRKQMSFSQVEDALNSIGFKRRSKNYRDPDTPSGQTTTREYYRIEKIVLEEHHAHEEEADGADD